MSDYYGTPRVQAHYERVKRIERIRELQREMLSDTLAERSD